MDRLVKKRADRERRHRRARQKVAGTAGRPRLAVYRSLRHIYAQIIDDDAGRTLFAAFASTACRRSPRTRTTTRFRTFGLSATM